VLSERGQVVIPKRIRDVIKVEKGDEFEVEIVGGDILLRPVRRFKAKRWQDYDGVADGIVDMHVRDKEKERREEDVYP